MNAPAHLPLHSGMEIDARRDRVRGYVIALDPESSEMEARLRTATRRLEAISRLLVVAATVLGTVCLISQAMKWMGM